MRPEPQVHPKAGKKPKRRSAFGWFVHRYGWRAYALPALVAVTVVVIIQAFGPGAPPTIARPNSPTIAQPNSATIAHPTASGIAAGLPTPSSATTVNSSVPATVTVSNLGPTTTVVTTAVSSISSANSSVSTGPDPNGHFAAAIKDGMLPPGAPYAQVGKGTWHTVKGTTPRVGSGAKVYTYTVDAEDGIASASADRAFASDVDAALADPRSWIGGEQLTLQRVDTGTPSFRVSLTSPITLRGSCGYGINLESSCYNRSIGRVLINDSRWVRGAVSFNGDLGSYRVYAINHEVGHALGYGHQPCGQNGGLAPVMMQQSFSTSDDELFALDPQGPVPGDHKVCRYNAFPYPRGSTG
ncbi:MAG: DUF3152 domain-containing protein [Actinomycetota bacterium]|nr:DUF3152 domain-containing protein [Actinomycetota bacterium]